MAAATTCAVCGKSARAADLVYQSDGALVCDDCKLATSIRRNTMEGQREASGGSGFVDRLFLRHLSPVGRFAYFVGQILLVVGYLGVGLLGLEWSHEDEWLHLWGGVIAIVIVWGLVCVLLWRFDPEAFLKTGADLAEENRKWGRRAALTLLGIFVFGGGAAYHFYQTEDHGELEISAVLNGAPVEHADVTLDGEKVCEFVPCLVRARVGSHRVHVAARMGGDGVAATEVTVSSGKRLDVKLDLDPVSSPPAP